MPLSTRSPFGIDHRTSPFGDLNDEPVFPPHSQQQQHRGPRSSRDSLVTAAAVSSHNSNLSNSGRDGSAIESLPAQRRLSDMSSSNSALMEASLTPSSTSVRPPVATPPSQSKAPVNLLRRQPQQTQTTPRWPRPSPLPHLVFTLSTHPPSASPALISAPTQSSTDQTRDTLPSTKTQRRTVGFASSPIVDTLTPLLTETSPQPSSNVFSDSRTSAFNASDSRTTQQPSGVTTQLSRIVARTGDNVHKTVDGSVSGTDELSSKPQTKEPAEYGDPHKDMVSVQNSRNNNSGEEGDSKGGNDNRVSSHTRDLKMYTNLVIQKPSRNESLDISVESVGGTTTLLPGADPKDEAQFRVEGGALNSARLPVFDRAKQALLTPGLGNISSSSPRLRHAIPSSTKGSNHPVSLSGVNSKNNSNNPTPRSTIGRRLSILLTPLLPTPIHRQQISDISSPLVVSRSVLEEPAKSPATFGDRLKEMGNEEVCVKTHMVWQMREGRTRCKLSPDFLLISVNERVCIHWYDSTEEVFETDYTYLNVVPGGRHSCYNAATPLESNEMVNNENNEATETTNMWSLPEEGSHGGTTSHTLGRPRGNPADTLAIRPLPGTTIPSRGGDSTPLVIRARTPRLGRTDLLGGALDPNDAGALNTLTARQAPRASRFASEIFATNEEDGDESLDASNRVSASSDPNVREMNLFANSTAPLTTNHSRQPSTNWMLQRSTTRQLLAENYQSFTISFLKPGEYYFVCSKHKRTMRLHVQVRSEKSLIRWRYVFAIVAAILVLALIVIVVVVLAYWMQHNTYLFGENEVDTYKQYIAFLKIHDLITIKLFPFLATGVLIVLIVILAANGWAVYRCFKPARQGAYTRGVKTTTRRVFVCGTIFLIAAIIGCLFIAFGLEMNVMNGVNQMALSIGSGVTNTLNLYSTAVLQVNYIVNETSVLFPDINLPLGGINNITDEIRGLMGQVVHWTSFVEDIAQVAFRVIPIVIFLAMQLGLFAACLTVGAIVLGFRRAAMATTWMLAASLGVFAVVCGIEYAVTTLFGTVYDSVVVLHDDPASFGTTLGLANDSFVAQLLSYCTITVSDVSAISQYVNDLLLSINATLDEKGQQEFSTIFKFIEDMIPMTIEVLVNYTAYVEANVDVLQRILDENGSQMNDLANRNVVPLLRTVLTVIRGLQSLVNCQVIRDIVAGAIPIFQNEVRGYNNVVFSFLLIVFGISFMLLVFSIGTTYSIRHPRRVWCNLRSGRWFRYRYSYKTHLHTLMQGSKAKVQEETVLQWLVHHTVPLMYRLLTVKLICFSSCMLMFFDSILIVLFNEVSRGTRTSKMLQALSYFGCAVLLFWLLASVFRSASIRCIFHTCSLLCAAACLGVSCAQAITGFVYFGQCVRHSRYETDAATAGSPIYMTCSATYMGYNLEVAIYAVIIFCNSVTAVGALAIQLRYEHNLKATSQRLHYVGFLSPLENFFPCLRCVFTDYLLVKRICFGFLIFVTILFLVLFTALNVGQWSVIRGVTKPTLKDLDTIQVIDPTVGCNGDSRYCALRTNQIIWACTHNAHSSLEDGFVLPNHYYNITQQLSAGIRSFMVDVWYDKINSSVSDEEDVYVCHTVCLMGRRRWRDIAREFKEFLDRYPTQVIMIIFEQYVNSSSLGQISDEVGLTQYAWHSDQVAPNLNPDYTWPTLQQLINKNQRAMMFNDVVASSNQSIDCPEWLYYAFDYQYENSYQTPNVLAWTCDVGRGWCTDDPAEVNCSDPDSSRNSACSDSSSSYVPTDSTCSRNMNLHSLDITNCTIYGADPLWKNGSAAYNTAFKTNPPNVRSKMSVMNHFITNGGASPVQATLANQPTQVKSTTYMCSSTWNTVVNILAFDFWNIANPLGTIQEMNQNLVKYGRQYNFQNHWSKMLFGTAS